MPRAMDEFLIRKTRSVLICIEEWLSISQRTVERWLIVIFLATFIKLSMFDFMHTHSIVIDVIMFVWCALVLINLHNYSEDQRAATGKIQRIWFFYASLLATLHMFHLLNNENVAQAVNLYAAEAFFYVIASNVKGERGRRRRMAMAKLRELFGPLWTPEPDLET